MTTQRNVNVFNSYSAMTGHTYVDAFHTSKNSLDAYKVDIDGISHYNRNYKIGRDIFDSSSVHRTDGSSDYARDGLAFNPSEAVPISKEYIQQKVIDLQFEDTRPMVLPAKEVMTLPTNTYLTNLNVVFPDGVRKNADLNNQQHREHVQSIFSGMLHNAESYGKKGNVYAERNELQKAYDYLLYASPEYYQAINGDKKLKDSLREIDEERSTQPTRQEKIVQVKKAVEAVPVVQAKEVVPVMAGEVVQAKEVIKPSMAGEVVQAKEVEEAKEEPVKATVLLGGGSKVSDLKRDTIKAILKAEGVNFRSNELKGDLVYRLEQHILSHPDSLREIDQILAGSGVGLGSMLLGLPAETPKLKKKKSIQRETYSIS